MSKNTLTSGLINYITYSSGSLSTSGSLTVTGSLNATNGITGSFQGVATTASYVLNAVSSSFATTASYAVSASITTNAVTSSHALNAVSSSFATTAVTSSFANAFTVAGTLTATTLVVQTITSSVLYSSGSNIFGNSLSNTQLMTGSVGITGSLSVNGTGTFTNDVNTSTKFKGRVGGSGVAFETTNAVDADFTIETVSGGTTKIGTSGNKLSILAGVGNMILSKPSSDTILTIGTTGEVPTIKAGGTNTDLKLEATGSGGNLYFYTNSTLKMLVNAAGNVGIGTSSPTNLITLQKLGSVSTTPGIDFRGTLSLGGAYNSLDYNSGRIYAIFDADSYASARVTIAYPTGAGTFADGLSVKNGNVGIGITGPDAKLHIQGTPSTNSDAVYNVIIQDPTAFGSRLGSGISFGGYYDATNTTYTFANIKGFKENLTSGDYAGALAFTTRANGGNPTERMRITSGGNVGIGTTSPASLLHMYSSSGARLRIQSTASTFSLLDFYNDTTPRWSIGIDNTQTYGKLENRVLGYDAIRFYDSSNNVALTPTNGNVLVGTTTDSGARIDARMTVAGKPVISAINNNVADSRCYYGQKYNSSTDDYYMIFDNVVANKFLLYGNGGLGNVQANDVNISDIRTKKDIIPLESYWNKFKAIEIVKFKYKDQTHDDYNIGVIAQQLEEVAPEFVNAEDWGKDTPAQTEQPLKSVYTTDLYHATIKVLQEAMAKIETLELRITQLENK